MFSLIHRRFLSILFAVTVVLLSPGRARGAVITFEEFSDGTTLSNQIAGLAFQNSLVLSAGLSLNELEFPPFSGTNGIVDDGGAIRIDFDTPLSSVGGYFTYSQSLTLTALGESGQVLGSAISGFASNLALSGALGSGPNEFLGINASGISSLVVSGGPAGGTFLLDDLTFSVAAVPLPGTFGLVLLALFLLRLRFRPLATTPS